MSASRVSEGPSRSEQKELPTRTSLLGATIALPFLAVSGELLIERTHHRPLGAATFATMAVIVWLTAESLSCHTLDRTLSAERLQARRVIWGLSLLLSVGVLLRSFL
jgi:hypothetical protein